MKRTETRTVTKPVTETVVLEHKCDLCGVDKPDRGDWPGLGDYAISHYRVAETEVTCKVGYSYPEGGAHMEYTFDVCPRCFIEKLIPWFESQGAQVQKREVDW